MLANMNTNPVLNDETRTLMHAPGQPPGQIWGLGFALRQSGAIVGHGGSNIGWKAMMSFVPSTGEGIVILTNADSGVRILDKVVCSWAAVNARTLYPLYKEGCEEMQAAERWGYAIAAGITLLFIVCLVFLSRRVSSPQYQPTLSLRPIVRALLIAATGLTVTLWLAFWHTELGVSVFYGFSGSHAIDHVPYPFMLASWSFVMLLLACFALLLYAKEEEQEEAGTQDSQ